MKHDERQFLEKLHAVAQQQAVLKHRSWLPSWMSPLSSYVGQHTLSVLLVLSIMSAVIKLLVEVVR